MSCWTIRLVATREHDTAKQKTDGGEMSIFEAIGMAWVIFTAAIATVEILYLAYIGMKSLLKQEVRDSDVPVEVKEMFKIAR